MTTNLNYYIADAIERFRRLLSDSNMEEKQHQISGIEWCLKNEVYLHKGGLIADEMGLGKTLQMLGVINGNPVSHTLIVVPLALLDQWKIAIQEFLGSSPLIYHGTNKRKITVDSLSDNQYRIVLTTYGQISVFKNKKNLLHMQKWNRVCFDEAHHLRNPRTGMHRGAMALEAPIRWLMTGTPIQNSKRDFYSLCEAIGLEAAYFTKQENLMELVKTYIMKRTKKSIGLELPPLTSEQELLSWDTKEEALLAEQIHSVLDFSST